MRCGRMRCGDIWRCGGKKQKPSKPGFTYIDFWGVSGEPLVGRERSIFITCEPNIDDEPIVEVDNPSIARLIRVEDNSTELGKYYNAYFDILAEGSFTITVKSKNNPSVRDTKGYYAVTPTPIETFSFNEDTITIPENRTVFTSATFTPSDAYVWQGLDISAPEGDTNLQVYNGTGGYINLYGYSSAPAGAMRTLSAKSFGGPVLDTVEADVVEVVEPTSITFVEHNITLTIGQEVSPEVIKNPSDTNVNLILQPNDWSVAGRGFTPFSIVGQGAGTTQVDLIDWDTGETYDTCTVTVEAPVFPTIEFVDGDTEINVGETGTLRFRYTNAISFSANDNPSVASVTNISSDEEYCYVTYEGVGAGQANIQCVAWNGNNPSDTRVSVTVIGEQPTNPVITLLEADTSIATGQYGMARFTITGSDYQNVGVEDSNIVETWSAGWNDEVYEFVYKGINEGTTNIFVSARNDEGGATTYPVTINVTRHPGPGITFDHGDTEINVGETGVLAFRTINADRYTYNSDDPSIASVTTITDDPRFVYYTYQGNSAGQTYIYGIVIDEHDDTAQAGVQVTVNGSPQPQLEPVTSISQFSTDYTTIAGDIGMWYLGTITPSENGDPYSISMPQDYDLINSGFYIEGNSLYGYIGYQTPGDHTFIATLLENGNQYEYTFHVQSNIPVESFEEDLGAGIEIPEGQRGQMQFTYTPINATNFDGLSWTSSDIEVADVDGFWYNGGTLFQYILGKSEGTCTITGSYNNVPFTTINVTVVPAVPYEISGLSEQSVTATVGTQRDVNVSGNSNANDFNGVTVTSSDDNIARAGFSGRIDSFGNSTLYIHPQSEGTCTITIDDGINSFDCAVTVTEPAPAHPTITGVESDNVTVDENASEARVAFYYSGDGDENDFSVTSSDTHIIRASLYGVYSGLGEIILRPRHDTGNAVVTLSDGTNNFDINVTVVEGIIPIEYLEDVDTSEKTVGVGNTVDSSFSFRPRDATDKSMITVVSSDELVATATYDATRRYDAKVIITGVGEGNCTITLSEGVNNFEIPVVVTEQHENARAD